MPGDDPASLMRVAAEVAREAGALIRERVPQTREIRTKASDVDLVTDARGEQCQERANSLPKVEQFPHAIEVIL